MQVPARLGGNYVDAVSGAKLVTASPEQVQKVQRWRVNDNLAGTRHLCPTLVKTQAFVGAANLDVLHLFGQLADEFGEDLLRRAAAWMTLRESKASFAIEGEADRANRIQRFADVMARRTGQGEPPLTGSALAELQREILGGRTTLAHFGVRQSPVFVGESVRSHEVVHYVAPAAEDLPAMLEGLRVFLERTQGQSPVMRSAVAAFGFVYVHPLADGNGRVHRFLINDVLRRDGVIPEPVILPVSAVITDDAGDRRGYDRRKSSRCRTTRLIGCCAPSSRTGVNSATCSRRKCRFFGSPAFGLPLSTRCRGCFRRVRWLTMASSSVIGRVGRRSTVMLSAMTVFGFLSSPSVIVPAPA